MNRYEDLKNMIKALPGRTAHFFRRLGGKCKAFVKKHPIFKFLGIAFLLCIIGCGVFLYTILKDSPKLTAIEDARPIGYRTTVYDDDEETMLTLSAEGANRVYVKSDQIPDSLKKAVVSIEDVRFYKHGGIDLMGIMRAVGKGITRGGISEGASTVTQQLIKNNIFTDWTEEVTFMDRLTRKVQEWFLAMKLERNAKAREGENYKDWILENYLNTINLGGGNWGVETASKYYFGKSVSEITLSESAVLAAVIKNPTKYNPLKNPENNEGRRTIVLRNMLDNGYITEKEMEEALEDDVYTRIETAGANGRGIEILDYFEDELIQEVLEDLKKQLGFSEEEAWNMIYKGGLNIYSTKDTAIQTTCEQAANAENPENPDSQVAIVVMDQHNGQIKAIVGGRGEKNASLTLNRATDSIRQPGSTIKVIGEYAAALESGKVSLGTVMKDEPHKYSNGTKVKNHNGKFMGRMTVSEAIAESNNILALKCFQKMGMDKVWAQIEKFGISTLTEEDQVEALALGGTHGGVNDLELTAAFCAIADAGTYREPITYTKVLDREGKVLMENTQESHQAIKKETAELLTYALRNSMKNGTATAARFDGMALAGKTGTTNGRKDAWFVGYSPYYTCGVWGGRDDSKSLQDTEFVQTLWKQVMQESTKMLTDQKFATDGLVRLNICGKCGKLAVDGLCEYANHGDATEKVYFVAGTEPTENCDCHAAATVCSTTGFLPTQYCPDVMRRVYLLDPVEGTEEEKYKRLPALYCGYHENLFLEEQAKQEAEAAAGGESGAEAPVGP